MRTYPKRIISLGIITAVAAFLSAGAVLAQPVLTTKDKVASRVGVFRGGSQFTLDKGGHTGLAGDLAVDFGTGTGPVYVQDASFVNALAQNDEMTVSVWIKKYDIVAGSAFWFNSPSSSSGTRGFQAHIPWDNDQVYFDTGGCCNPPQRINQSITQFAGYTGDDGWWTNWHFFVFTKKGVNKQVYIDGQLFMDQPSVAGVDAAPLPTDFTDLYIGSAGDGNGLFHAVVDDFAVFGTALSEASIGLLFGGNLPSALPSSDKLTAWWDFNDPPSEGAFVSVLPAPNTVYGAPNLIEVVHNDGSTPWGAGNISLKVDDVSVTPTFVKSGLKATLSYVPTPVFGAQTTHKATLTYPGATGTATLEWKFTVGAYTKDVVNSRIGVFTGGSAYSASGGGHSGAAGDYAANFGNGTGPVHVPDGTFLNALATNDEMAFAFWLKKPGIEAASAFWADSPSGGGDKRGFQAHTPWSDNVIYFDTAGCCNPPQRINQSITQFAGYSGDTSWWTNWHFFVFSKKGVSKEVWIDGQLFMDQSLAAVDAAPLPTDFTDMFIGGTAPGVNLIRGQIDDFAIFGTALSQDSITKLFAGTLPTALPATDKLTAWWNFNELPSSGVFASITPAPDTRNAQPNIIRLVHWDGTTAWDASKVTLKLNDAAVTPTFTKNGIEAIVSYTPNPLLAAGSTNKAALTFPGVGATPDTLEWQFVVGPYSVLGDSLWTALGTGDSTKPGFKVRVWQVDQPGSVALGNRTHRAEQELAGIIGPNVADLTAATDGLFNISLVNWNQDYQTASIGNFAPDDPIPGIPGTGGKPDDSIAAEVIAYVEFPTAGYYGMGVNSDDGFKVTVTDTPPAHNLALVVTGAASAAGVYHALSAPPTTARPFTNEVSGTLVYVDPADGCGAAVNGAALNGKIALVDRGTCDFSTKIQIARTNGAIAVVVVNNRDAANAQGVFPIEMSVGAVGYQDIPAVMISMPDGDKIKTGLPGNVSISLTPDTTPAVGEFDGGRGSADTIFGFVVPTAGVYPLRCVWYEGGGGANLEWFTVLPAGEKILINDTAKISALKAFRARTANPVQRPTMSIANVGGVWKITYTGTLQSSPTVNTGYTDVQGATSPYTVDTSTGMKFFRARN